METMVYNYFEEKARRGEPVPDSYESLTRDFVQTLPRRIDNGESKEPVYDETVDSGMNRSERQEAAAKAEKANAKLEEANRLKAQGRTKEAKEKLREVHGEGFN
jgi:hypothetical protein